jgi:hypothetical protein
MQSLPTGPFLLRAGGASGEGGGGGGRGGGEGGGAQAGDQPAAAAANAGAAPCRLPRPSPLALNRVAVNHRPSGPYIITPVHFCTVPVELVDVRTFYEMRCVV